MVRQWQDLFYEGRYASSYLETTPDFVKLAKRTDVGSGKQAIRDRFFLKEAIAVNKPVIVDVRLPL